MRLLDIPAAQAFGAWDAIHGATSPAAISDAIKRAAAQHHGQAGRAFLEKLTFDTSDLCAMLEEVKAAPMFATDGLEGQDKRAAARFALIGLAGELATDYGVTGWPEGAAGEAAAHGFKLWQSMRGKGNDERRQILQRVSGFIERHGDGRFSAVDTTDAMQIRERAGWWRDTNGGREYLFTTLENRPSPCRSIKPDTRCKICRRSSLPLPRMDCHSLKPCAAASAAAPAGQPVTP